MKNILAAIMLMGATVSVDAMTIEKVKELADERAMHLRWQFTELSQMSIRIMPNQMSYCYTYMHLERIMLEDAERLHTLATQCRDGDIDNVEQMRTQGREYTHSIVNSFYDCRDHLRSWGAALERNTPSHLFSTGNTRAAGVIALAIENLRMIADDALNLRRNLPGGAPTTNDIAEAKADRAARRNAPHNAAAEQE